jgi:outer membrane protein TolC
MLGALGFSVRIAGDPPITTTEVTEMRSTWIMACAMAAGSSSAIADRADHVARHARVAERAEAHEPTERVALADMLAAAVRRSPSLVIARADLTDAGHREVAADAIDAWHLIGRFDAGQTLNDPALVGPGGLLDQRTIGGDIGLRRNFSTGGDVEVAVGTSQVNYLYEAIPGPTAQSRLADQPAGGIIATTRIVASQPVLRGAGADAARADQKLAKLAARTQAAQADDEAAELVRELVVAYWELAYANEQLAVDHDGIELVTRQAAITQDIVRLGLQPPNAVKIAQAEVALKQEEYLRDDQTRGDDSLSLRRLAGLELADEPLVPAESIDVTTADRSEPDVIAAAAANGPGIVQKRLAVRSGDVNVNATHNALLPKLDLSLTAEASGVGLAVGNAFGNIDTGQVYSVMGGVTMQWDLGGAAKAAAASARDSRARAEADRAELEHEVEGAARSAVRQLDHAHQRIELGHVAVDAASEALRAETVAFQAGRSTVTSVFQRQDELAQARLRLARAQVDAIEADVELDYLTGALLERYGITVGEKS